MGKIYEDEDDGTEGLTEEQARRLVKKVIELGHSEAEAYEALAYVMNATCEQRKSEPII